MRTYIPHTSLRRSRLFQRGKRSLSLKKVREMG
jgi:hypothetical protein